MFGIILTSMAVAGIYLVQTLPPGIGLGDAVHLADLAGRMNVITTTFDLDDKYNLWSGLFGGFFLALSYFGTDQSQVGRFLTGRDVRESRIGLLVNGIVKIPMQFSLASCSWPCTPSYPHRSSSTSEWLTKHVCATLRAQRRSSDCGRTRMPCCTLPRKTY
jgi:hypothetical protein